MHLTSLSLSSIFLNENKSSSHRLDGHPVGWWSPGTGCTSSSVKLGGPWPAPSSGVQSAGRRVWGYSRAPDDREPGWSVSWPPFWDWLTVGEKWMKEYLISAQYIFVCVHSLYAHTVYMLYMHIYNRCICIFYENIIVNVKTSVCNPV